MFFNVHRRVPVEDVGYAIVPRILRARGDQSATAAHRLGVDVGMLARCTHIDQYPTRPPAAAPTAAPARVATRAPSATTGPTPGIAIMPSPANRPTPPRTAAPIVAPGPAAVSSVRSATRSTGVVGICVVAIGCFIGDQTDIARFHPCSFRVRGPPAGRRRNHRRVQRLWKPYFSAITFLRRRCRGNRPRPALGGLKGVALEAVSLVPLQHHRARERFTGSAAPYDCRWPIAARQGTPALAFCFWVYPTSVT